MAKPSVTVVRCRACGRIEGITSENDRFWCAWCQDWVAVDAVAVTDAVLVADGDTFRLAPVRKEDDWLCPLRVPTGWLIEWNVLGGAVPDATEANLFLATHEPRRRVIDVDSRGGTFRLRVLPLVTVKKPRRGRDEPLAVDWDGPLHTFTTSSLNNLVEELEASLRGERE